MLIFVLMLGNSQDPEKKSKKQDSPNVVTDTTTVSVMQRDTILVEQIKRNKELEELIEEKKKK